MCECADAANFRCQSYFAEDDHEEMGVLEGQFCVKEKILLPEKSSAMFQSDTA